MAKHYNSEDEGSKDEGKVRETKASDVPGTGQARRAADAVSDRKQSNRSALREAMKYTGGRRKSS